MKFTFRTLLLFVTFAFVAWTSVASAVDSVTAKANGIRVLFLGDSGRSHQPESRFRELQEALQGRVEITYTENVSDLEPRYLSSFDAVLLFADIDAIDPVNGNALLSYIRKGGGFVPVHCASYCFRNMPEFVALVGAQFKEHGSGLFRTEIARPDHPLMKRYGGFESWDETYVHQFHNEANRTVLEYRVTESGREPWTWIRREGKGRVFYTAWGHDAATWTNPGFQNLIERGIRWAAGGDPLAAGDYMNDLEFPVPAIKPLPKNLKPFEFVDVDGKIPMYVATEEWRVQDKPKSLMQKPLLAEESLKHIVVPEGFHVELFASDPDIDGKPISMAWDARGRLWVAETLDYPNDLHPDGYGNDRIRICEDTDGDGRADRFTVFAEELSIPSTLVFSNGGVIVQNGTQTIFLRDTNGDDKADERQILLTNWGLEDTHGGVSNFKYGLDNWIWGMQGYNQSEPTANEKVMMSCRMGFFRFPPDVSQMEFIRSTNNNTWGLGFSEEGLVFGSTANSNPSVYMPMANRYYERVRGWTPSLTLSSIADNYLFDPITENCRQVDSHGGYTSATGHALYTAREYPREYWNSVAFVNGPTGHLVGAFALKKKGSDFSSKSDFNFFASDDEWASPTMSEVGPDGTVWVIDWYNYILQHNPTPDGFETGSGGAYETTLRDKHRGRIYRIVPDDFDRPLTVNLEEATATQLVNGLTDPSMVNRLHAQRLLVERGQGDVIDELVALARNETIDEIGLNVGAIHALWTLHGLGLLDGNQPVASRAAYDALRHPSAGVRRNAARVLPLTDESVAALLDAELLTDADPHVQLAAILALSDLAVGPIEESTQEEVAGALLATMKMRRLMSDRWIPDAITSAAAQYSPYFLRALQRGNDLPTTAFPIVQRVAEHYARNDSVGDEAVILAHIESAQTEVLDCVIAGFSAGGSGEQSKPIDRNTDKSLQLILERVSPSSKGALVRMAAQWNSKGLARYRQGLVADLLKTVRDEDAAEADRISAAAQAIDFLQSDRDVVVDVFNEITPRTTPTLAVGLIQAMQGSRWKGLGDELIGRLNALTPSARRAAFSLLLKRSDSTLAILNAAKQGNISLSELALDQQQALVSHPDEAIRALAKHLLAQGGALPNANRMKVMSHYQLATIKKGDVERGRQIYIQNCASCHVHRDLGQHVGPDLTGMAVHPKQELLTHILDPNRSVEGNYRAYTVLTVDGVIQTGMLASESKTAIELVDTKGKTTNVLRDDIEELVASTNSIMPEGFENAISREAMTDLLEYLVSRSRYVPISLDRYATAISTSGMFHNDGPDHFTFVDWKPKYFKGIPFHLTDPIGQSRPNVIMLHCLQAANPSRMPASVTLPCNMPAGAIHFLSGVAGWGYPCETDQMVTMTVRLKYSDGQSEDHSWINGVHFADYIQRTEVPGSEFAFGFERGQQLRYLRIIPRRTVSIESIELVKGPSESAPVVVAVTVEPIRPTQ
ncbi:hypothetical protein FHS27_001733 [Rhodopirellula rubra]|uniref:Cytochrome c domain-containing protein n=1 Tax=Aporhodopirellula rubra TaxID=980271 RepID=A0A7W5DWV4_9BACT|nr:PVC-type heme-binding CxxCH protein [Aporhodopirellula rubra]MBB3205925.1 hypothetical protein [Aporhodopirellula rubra]